MVPHRRGVQEPSLLGQQVYVLLLLLLLLEL
jgi:hypothetical protein